MVLDTALLNIQQYKVRIKGKEEGEVHDSEKSDLTGCSLRSPSQINKQRSQPWCQ